MFEVKSKSLRTELYRKSIHLSSLWMPFIILLANKNWNILLFFTLFVGNFIIEYMTFKKLPYVSIIFRKLFIKTLRYKEIDRISFVPSGSVFVLAAALIVSVCFTPKAGAAALTVMLIADTAAALVGKSIGKFHFSNGKTFEGTLAFFISSVLVILSFYPHITPLTVLITAVFATATEFFEKDIGIDDNLMIPLVTGFILNLI
jgi:dolichol kinase